MHVVIGKYGDNDPILADFVTIGLSTNLTQLALVASRKVYPWSSIRTINPLVSWISTDLRFENLSLIERGEGVDMA